MSGYRTVFVGTLVQESALSPGGTWSAGTVDMPVCRDGAGRPTLTGATLAGALTATVRRLLGTRGLSPAIAGNPRPRKNEEPIPSVWHTYSTHPASDNPENRQSVGILQSTGAAATGVLFDFESLPPDTKWPFCLEVDRERSDGEEKTALAALKEWTRGRCWLGRSVARGLGWMRLDGLKAYRLEANHWTFWPDSQGGSKEEPSPESLLEKLAQQGKIPPPIRGIELLEKEIGTHPATQPVWYAEWRAATIRAGQRDDGWGLDCLSVQGHDNPGQPLATKDAGQFLRPRGRIPDPMALDLAPDHLIAMTRRADRKDAEPFVPGASIRGVLRHALSRSLRKRGVPIRDPLATRETMPNEEPCPIVDEIFGSIERSASLLVRDAFVNGIPTAAFLEQHAEDEFSGGAFSSAKFNRIVLTDAWFEFRMVLEAPTEEELKKRIETLQPVFRLGRQRHLPLGGAQWRGAGWVEWDFGHPVLYTAGGEVLPR